MSAPHWRWLTGDNDPPPPPEPETDWTERRSCCGCHGIRCDCVCCGSAD